MKLIIKILLIFISISGNSQIDPIKISNAQIPDLMTYKDDFITCVAWYDKLGHNYLILSETKLIVPEIAKEARKEYSLFKYNGKIDTVYSEEAYYRQKEIYAYHYVQSDNSITLLWKMWDYVNDCPYDLNIAYFNDSPLVTDFDDDGICETWLIYSLSCRSDMSPEGMKIIMHIKEKKYAIRGRRSIKYGSNPDDFFEGEMKYDNLFLKLPEPFTDFSLELWNKYKNENF